MLTSQINHTSLFLCPYTIFSPTQTHIHGSNVIVICLPHFLHDFLFGQAARFDRALHRNCPLWVIKGQILQSALRDIKKKIVLRTLSRKFGHWFCDCVLSMLTVKSWSWYQCLVPLSSGCVPLCQSNGQQSCCEQEPSEAPHRHYQKCTVFVNTDLRTDMTQ